ncbi:hypothetical protein LTA6_001492 [Microbacterium sp. LTA6]|uniref:hypothetical protein n=1 Tax=Microbacterium sp. LTA6 TaxID=3129771 RepID=UPI0032555A75
MSDPQQPPVSPYASGDHRYPPATPQPAYPPAPPQPGSPLAGQPQPAHPTYPTHPTYGAQPPAASGNALGRAAFLIALITFGIGLLGTLAIPLVYTVGIGTVFVEIITSASGLISVIGYAAALVLGIVALRRPAPHILAGIAIGIAGSGVVGTAVAWIATLFYRFI